MGNVTFPKLVCNQETISSRLQHAPSLFDIQTPENLGYESFNGFKAQENILVESVVNQKNAKVINPPTL